MYMTRSKKGIKRHFLKLKPPTKINKEDKTSQFRLTSLFK